MKANKMWLDGLPKNSPANTTKENQNIVIIDSDGSFETEFNITQYGDYNKELVGEIPLNNNELFVLSSDNSFGIVQSNGKYKNLYQNNDLNFSTARPIHGIYITTELNKRVVAFTDGYTTPKYVNIDDPIDSNLNLFVFNDKPEIDISVEDGGSLEVGGYSIFCRYITTDETPSNFYKDYKTKIIYESNKNKSGSISSKSIQLDFTSLNTNKFKFIEIGLIRSTDSVLQAFIVKKIKITSSSLSYVITGQEQFKAIDLNNVIEDNAIYKKLDLLKLHTKNLYAVGTEIYKESDNIQSLVNSIETKWVSKLIQSSELNTLQDKGFAHNEVYCLYIKFRWDWGYSKEYPLIGRSATATDLEEITFGGLTALRWQLEETCAVTSTDANGVKIGTFPYHENKNTDYPDNLGFPSGKTRFFKFPSHNWMHNNAYSDTEYGASKLDILGIKLENLNLNTILDSDGNSATGYEVKFAKRTVQNSTVVGQSIGILQTTNEFGLDSNKHTSTGGNFSINSSNGDFNDTLSSNYIDQTSIRLYCPELLVNDFDINIDRLFVEYGLTSKRLLLGSDTLRIITDDEKTGASKYVNGLSNYIEGESIQENFKILRVDETIKLLNNTIKGNNDNVLLEETIKVTTNLDLDVDISPDVDTPTVLLDSKPDIINVVTNGFEHTKLVTLKLDKDDVYSDFLNNITVSCGGSTVDGYIFGGDIFISAFSFNCYSRYIESSVENIEYSDNGGKQGYRDGHVFTKYHLLESVYNFNHIIQDVDVNVKHYPDFSLTSELPFKDQNKTSDPNLLKLVVNKDFSITNSFQINSINGSDIEEYADVDEFKVARSFKTSDRLAENIRLFKKDDIYILPRNTGKPVNIVSGKSAVMIHTENSLYVTASSDRAMVDQESGLLQVSVGNIFEYPLSQIKHSQHGLLGTSNRYSCLNTPYGYIFTSLSDKKIYLLSENSLEVLSSKGIERLFLSLIDGQIIGDNPYIDKAIQVVYDEKYDRIIYNIKFDKYTGSNLLGIYNSFYTYVEGDTVLKDNIYQTKVNDSFIPSTDITPSNLTLSYSFKSKGWACFHTHNYSRYIQTMDNVISYDTNKLYRHNDTQGKLEFSGVQEQAFISYILRTIDEKLNKQYAIKSITWDNSSFDFIKCYNNYQDTGNIELKLIEPTDNLIDNYKNKNLRKNRDKFVFSNVRDYTTNQKLVDSYVVIRLLTTSNLKTVVSELNVELYEN